MTGNGGAAALWYRNAGVGRGLAHAAMFQQLAYC